MRLKDNACKLVGDYLYVILSERHFDGIYNLPKNAVARKPALFAYYAHEASVYFTIVKVRALVTLPPVNAITRSSTATESPGRSRAGQKLT